MMTLFPLASVGGDGLSTLWRIELLHPAVVHFSVALTLVGALFWLLAQAGLRWAPLRSFAIPAWLLLLLACLGTWASVQSGFWADEVVGRELFDPRPLKDHERYGLGLGWLLTAVVALESLRLFVAKLRPFKKWLAVLIALGLLGSCVLVGLTAHLGAGLVYQQGAGVQAPL